MDFLCWLVVVLYDALVVSNRRDRAVGNDAETAPQEGHPSTGEPLIYAVGVTLGQDSEEAAAQDLLSILNPALL